MQKNVASQKIRLFAFIPSTGLPKTGDAANITAYVSKDYGSVTVLADTSATEVDAINAKGWYSFDLAQAETNADELLFSAKSATSDVVVIGEKCYTTLTNVTNLTNVPTGSPDLEEIVARFALRTGTAQAGAAGTITLDTGASAVNSYYNNATILITSGTGAGQFRVISGYVGATKVATVSANWATNPSSDSVFLIQPSAAGSAGLDAAGVRAAVGLASANLDTQLGTIDDFLDTEVSAIKTKTDFLPSATAGAAGGLFIAGINAATTVTTALTATFTGNLTGNVGGSVTGAVASVTGAIGSVGAGGITAASIAADAIGASELAADAVAEIAAGVLAAASSAPIAASVEAINGVTIRGGGTAGNRWGPV